MIWNIDPLIAAGVVAATAATDAAYVFFNAAVASRQRWRAARGVGSGLSAFSDPSRPRYEHAVLCSAALRLLARALHLVSSLIRLRRLVADWLRNRIVFRQVLTQFSTLRARPFSISSFAQRSSGWDVV